VYARGRAHLRPHGRRLRVRLQLRRRPARGAYRLTLRIHAGRHSVVLRRTIRIR
jgi:hypothetical protein